MPQAATQLDIQQPVTVLKGVGPKMAERLARLHIHTLQDLLFHLPIRYQDRTRVVPIGSVRPGDEAVIEGEVQLTEIKFGKRRMLLSRISDGTGSLTLRFFHFNAKQQQTLERGNRLRCYGEVRSGPVTMEMIHPEFRRIDELGSEAVEETLTAVYPSTEGMHQASWHNLTEQVVQRLRQGMAVEELLPDEVRQQLQMPSLTEALIYIHRPPVDAPVAQLMSGEHPYQQRLAFEELLAHHLSLRVLRQQGQAHLAPVLDVVGELEQQLLKQLPFEPTAAQLRVCDEINADMQKPHPMLRLVQGDVGSGKTLVAAMAVLRAVEAGYQVALMAPTELLAEQHLQSFGQWLEPLGIPIAWISGRLKGKAREEGLAGLASGEARVAIGTHALFQESVQFQHLGLIIIDEQHRFGVHQRIALREKGRQGNQYPHQLIMTATPIPRTLAMTAYADLDVSIIDELPPGRTPVETVVISDQRRDEVVARIGQACAEGRQAYWVCTLIEESEVLQCQAAEDTATMLAEALPDLKIGLVHGRMKAEAKDRVMQPFKAGEMDLLVATTVIEVGVNVPNASLMVIENAERLGLSQLHQLRGRVGRGATASSCVLMYHGPLGQVAKERLAVMRETNDGFVIAQRDLEIRGPGEVLGTRQTGMMLLRIADMERDQELIPVIAAMSDRLIQENPQQVEKLIQRWIGEKGRYVDV